MASERKQHRNKQRIQLTVDPVLWERCQAFSERVPGFSWSQVAEVSFAMVIDQMEALIEELKKASPNSSPEVLSALMIAHYHRTIHGYTQDVYESVDELVKPEQSKKRKKQA